MVKDLVSKNGGSSEDASDLFQDGMVVVYEKAMDVDFTLSSSLKTYLYAVCKNKWLMQLRKRKTKRTSVLRETAPAGVDPNIHKDIVSQEKKN